MDETPLAVAILAAGASRRLGQPKQLVIVQGEPLLRRQSRVALAAGIGPVVVVVGCHAAACARTVDDLPLEIRVNPDWPEGLAGSIRHAVRMASERRAAGLLLILGDQYRITAPDLRALRAAWERAPTAAYVARSGDYTGPPVIIPADRYERALTLRGDRGARAILYDAGLPPPIEIESPRARFDLDRADQLELLHAL